MLRSNQLNSKRVIWFGTRARLGTSPKWTRFYSGPYRVVRKMNDVNYDIQLSPKSRQFVVHVNKIKRHQEFQLA